jgi:hypothetical protein
MQETSNHDRKLMVRYSSELLATLGLFFLALVVAHRYGWPLKAGPEKTLLTLCPILPFLLMILVLVRTYRRADEYWRQRMLQDWAITAALTGIWTFSYGFMENLGFPRLSMFTVWPNMGAICAFVVLFRRLTHR